MIPSRLLKELKQARATIESLQQEVGQCADCQQVIEIIHLRNEIAQKDEALEQAREALGLAKIAIRDYDSITEELALTAIDKALGGNGDE